MLKIQGYVEGVMDLANLFAQYATFQGKIGLSTSIPRVASREARA